MFHELSYDAETHSYYVEAVSLSSQANTHKAPSSQKYSKMKYPMKNHVQLMILTNYYPLLQYFVKRSCFQLKEYSGMKFILDIYEDLEKI